MQMTIGELVDRLTIEQRKAIYGGGNQKLIDAIEDYLQERYDPMLVEVILAAGELGILNDAIGVLEWQIREGQALPLAEIGRRAQLIRDLNAKRVACKNTLSRIWGQPESAVYYGIGPVKSGELHLEPQKLKS